MSPPGQMGVAEVPSSRTPRIEGSGLVAQSRVQRQRQLAAHRRPRPATRGGTESLAEMRGQSPRASVTRDLAPRQTQRMMDTAAREAARDAAMKQRRVQRQRRAQRMIRTAMDRPTVEPPPSPLSGFDSGRY